MVRGVDVTGALGSAEGEDRPMDEGLTEKAIKRLIEQKKQERSAGAGSKVVPVNSAESGAGNVTDMQESLRWMRDRDDSKQPKFSTGQLNSKRIVHTGMKDQDALKSFRFMRNKVIDKLDGRKDGVVLVSSAVSSGGGTFSAINLATVIAYEQGVRSTIVECNLRNSPLCRTLDIAPKRGWLDYIEDPSVSAREIIYATGINNVDLIAAGGQDQAVKGLVSLGKLSKLFDNLRAESNHFIIIDGPSLDSAGDPRIFSDISDCIVLVVPYGRVTPEKFKLSLRVVDNDKVAGVMLNRTPITS